MIEDHSSIDYICDPEKNIDCKTSYFCHLNGGSCHFTKKEKYAERDKSGKPLRAITLANVIRYSEENNIPIDLKFREVVDK